MDTKVSKINLNSSNLAVFKKAANILKNGGLVAFPTETVYGLGANALCKDFVKKIYEAKGRPSDNPLIVHISDISELSPLVSEIPKKAKVLIDHFWPGPLTIIFKKSVLVPSETSGGLDTVAVRMPKNQVARDLIKACGFPLAAPSANISGNPSPTSAEHVFKDLNGKIDMLIDAGPCDFGIESTVIDATEDKIVILRPGSITKEMLEELFSNVVLDAALLNEADFSLAKAPGMKYKHYAPKANVTLFKGTKTKVIKEINKILAKDQKNNVKSFVIATTQTKDFYKTDNLLVIGDENDYGLIAKNLFSFLRKCDDLQAEKIYIETFKEDGLGLSIMNRLKKASSHNIVDLW